MSYTKFEYSPIHVSKSSLTGNEKLTASVDVKNVGSYQGEEVVQLYISEPVASVTRAVKDLKGFQKISLNAGEAKTVQFEITPDQLSFYNNDLKRVWEAGDFIIQIGTNSADVKSVKVNWKK